MQTFTFSELDQRGQDYAVDRYGQEQEVDEYINALEDGDTSTTQTGTHDMNPADIFNAIGYRFNLHGERIA